MDFVKKQMKGSQEQKSFAIKFVSRKHLAAAFRTKDLKISNLNDNETLNKVESYLKTELQRLVRDLNNTADLEDKKIITLAIAEKCYNIKHSEESNSELSSRLFSSRYIVKQIHQYDKKVSNAEPVVELLEILLYKRLLHLVEKTHHVCAINRRIIIFPRMVDLAIEMVSVNQKTQ